MLTVIAFIGGAIIFMIAVQEILKRRYFTKLGIAYEMSWPLLGYLPTIMIKGILKADQDGIERLGKVHGLYLGNTPTIVVCNLQMIKEILVRQFHNFPYRMKALYVSKWWENGVVIASGDHWKYLRTLLCPTFSSGKLRTMQPVITKCLSKMVTNLKAIAVNSTGGQLDVKKYLGALTMDIICQTSFGIQTDTQSNLESNFSKNAKTVSTLSIESSPVNVLPLLFPKIKHLFELLDLDYVDKKSLNFFKDFIQYLVTDRKNSETNFNDTLQHLMNSHKMCKSDGINADILEYADIFQQLKSRGLNDDELVANALIVLMAGHDTTATTLTWMCYLLATNQHVQEKLHKCIVSEIGSNEPTYENVLNIEYLDHFLDETLRLYPAANRTGRDAASSTEVCGYDIPEGVTITIPIYALHRMPEYWEDPECCKPERFSRENKHNIKPYSYIPFGAGPRACIGIRMAQLLCKVIIVKLVQNFRLYVTKDLETPPAMEKSLLTKPLHGMPLRIVQRN